MKAYLTYALNQEGKLVHVEDVPNGNDCRCICPACKKPLQAKNAGLIREHHFAHQPGVDCPTALETALHLLAKEKIQKAFYEQDVFNMEFEYRSYCTNAQSCQYCRYDDCETSERKRFDLKQFYDSCEQEIPYDEIRRRSDLKIWSSAHPEIAPIYIEIFVTHQSEAEKLHSGSKIIEVKIEDESDIDEIIQKGFIEGKRVTSYHRENVVASKTSFYGFKTEDHKNTSINQEIAFSRYILYQSGKCQCYQDACLCKELKRERRNALCEICFHTDVAFGIHELTKWMGYKRFGIKNCLLCKNYVDSYDGMGKLCRLYKYLGINRYESHDTARAKTCQSFTLDEQEMNEYLKDEIKTPYTEL